MIDMIAMEQRIKDVLKGGLLVLVLVMQLALVEIAKRRECVEVAIKNEV